METGTFSAVHPSRRLERPRSSSAGELTHLLPLLSPPPQPPFSSAPVANTHRTSTSMMIRKFFDSSTMRIETRAAEMVGLPAENVEPLQVLLLLLLLLLSVCPQLTEAIAGGILHSRTKV